MLATLWPGAPDVRHGRHGAHGANVNQRDVDGERSTPSGGCGNAFRPARAPANTGDAGRRRVDGAHGERAVYSLVQRFSLQLADNKSGDRTTGEVLEDMYACMLDLLRAGAAIDFFHVAEGCGDPMRGLEDVILEVMLTTGDAGEVADMRHLHLPT